MTLTTLGPSLMTTTMMMMTSTASIAATPPRPLLQPTMQPLHATYGELHSLARTQATQRHLLAWQLAEQWLQTCTLLACKLLVTTGTHSAALQVSVEALP